MKPRVRTLFCRSALTILVIGGLTVLSVTLALQGWRARPLYPQFTDLAVNIVGADELIRQGRIPDRGGVSSTLARLPPGTTWLLAPGFLFVQDPRLLEVPMSALLLFLTLLGIVLLGRAWLNETCAWTAATLYAFSWIGIFFASSLWPRGHPVFIVWIVYFCYLAVERSRAMFWLLAWAAYVLGTYVFIEIAPAGAVLLAALMMRRSLFAWWVVPAMVLIASMVWWPYLRFQQSVRFVDVGRLASNNSQIPGTPAWCGANVELVLPLTKERVTFADLDVRYPIPPKDLSTWRALYAHKLPAIVRSFSWNSASSSTYGTLRSSVFLMLLLLGLRVAFVSPVKLTGTAGDQVVLKSFALLVISVTSLLLVLFQVLSAVDPRLDWSIVDSFSLFGLLIAACILMGATFLMSSTRQPNTPERPSVLSTNLSVLLTTGFLAGQLSWSLMAPAESRRFLWLWPLQCLLSSFAVSELSMRLGWRPLYRNAVAILLVMAFASPAVLRLRAWPNGAWEAEESPEIALLDQLANHHKLNVGLREPGPISISYDTVSDPFLLAANTIDRRYTSGMGYDLYLKYKHSIQQELTCADTYSARSTYVIRDDRRSLPARVSPVAYHTHATGWSGYVVLGRQGSFSLLWRPPVVRR